MKSAGYFKFSLVFLIGSPGSTFFSKVSGSSYIGDLSSITELDSPMLSIKWPDDSGP